MKKIFNLFVKPRISFLMLTILLVSFYSSAQTSSYHTYVIEFKDKGIASKQALNPFEYLSEKAVERRLKYNIPFTLEDLPVNSEYIQAIIQEGAVIKAYSRWFNVVVVESSPDIIASINEKSFVKSSIILDKATSNSRTDKGNFTSKLGTTTPWYPMDSPKQSTTDKYDYGAGYAQIDQIKGISLHNNGFDGKGMTIAVLDAGFNSVDVMTCFDSLRANNQIKGVRNMVEPGANVYSTTINNHGTNVLSLMASYKNGELVGTAPKADYYLIRTEDASSGSSEYILEEYYWVMGAEYADSVGADLINSSLGYTVFTDPTTNHTYMDMDGNTTVVTRGADKAAEKGILVVNSAGNEGGSSWKYIGAPADGDSVFSIGAVDILGNRAGFSSQGPTYDNRIKPDVCANGQSTAVFSPYGLQYGSGTSYSSPITCGMTACFWQANPTLNNMQVIEAIKLTSSMSIGPDSLLGWGIPNFEKAVNQLSINEIARPMSISCYPNPFVETLSIVFPNTLPSGNLEIEFYNIKSQMVEKSSIYSQRLRTITLTNLSNLPKGIYFIKASIDNSIYTTRALKL